MENFAEKVISVSEKLESIVLIYDADREKLDEVIDRHERFAEENRFDRDYYYEKVEFDDMEA